MASLEQERSEKEEEDEGEKKEDFFLGCTSTQNISHLAAIKIK